MNQSEVHLGGMYVFTTQDYINGRHNTTFHVGERLTCIATNYGSYGFPRFESLVRKNYNGEPIRGVAHWMRVELANIKEEK